MPVYCFTSAEGGATVGRVFPMGKAPRSVHVNGHPYMRDYQAEQVKVPSPAGWPMEPCSGSGVHPSQAQDLRDHFEKCGVPTEVSEDGDPVYRDKLHRERALKVRNLHDNN